MLRLAFTFILLLLMLFGGAVWLLDLTPEPQAPEKQAKERSQPKSDGKSETDELQEALKPAGKPSDGAAPKFDVARIDPNGTSVFAGRAEPRSLVTITVDGKEIGTAAADENGDWMLTTDAKIANPDGKLALFRAPPGTVPGVAGAAQQSAEAKPPAAANAQKPTTAGAVTAGMLKSLEGMVAAARTGDNKPPATIAAAPALPAKALETAPGSPAPAAAPAVQSTTVPVPVTFIYNEATLTTDGRKAASLLLEYLQLKHFPAITLTGHADERGSEELNMGLSRERLDTVAQFLREGGYRGQLKLVPKGKSEPYSGVVRGDFSQEDLWQLDRRVELVVSR
jgi:outer membrane protein OmpA-like peptidoglycan-associated protein